MQIQIGEKNYRGNSFDCAQFAERHYAREVYVHCKCGTAVEIVVLRPYSSFALGFVDEEQAANELAYAHRIANRDCPCDCKPAR